jgi:hypothetical protein
MQNILPVGFFYLPYGALLPTMGFTKLESKRRTLVEGYQLPRPAWLAVKKVIPALT